MESSEAALAFFWRKTKRAGVYTVVIARGMVIHTGEKVA